jgi:DNA polymerase-3 subunit alpha
MLSRGETVGVFQVESAGMRKALIGMRPDCIEDIIALVALYRPGPMENIPTYNARKHGEEEIESIHPTIDHLVKETQGVIVYQEQVMQIAQVLSGYSLGEADLLRRAMGKKIKAEMDKQRERFVDGAVSERRGEAAGRQHLRPAGEVRRLRFQQVARRRLRHRFLPDRLHEGALSGRVPGGVDDARHGNTDKLNDFRQDAKRLGIEVIAPSVQTSFATSRPARTASITRWPRSRASATRRSSTSSPRFVAKSRSSLEDFCLRIDPKQVNRACWKA